MGSDDGEWGQKGATPSNKTARTELDPRQEEIVQAIDAGSLQCRVGSMQGSPWLRLLRSEVEELVRSTLDERGLEDRTVSAELARVEREMKRPRRQLAALEQCRSELLA